MYPLIVLAVGTDFGSNKKASLRIGLQPQLTLQFTPSSLKLCKSLDDLAASQPRKGTNERHASTAFFPSFVFQKEKELGKAFNQCNTILVRAWQMLVWLDQRSLAGNKFPLAKGTGLLGESLWLSKHIYIQTSLLNMNKNTWWTCLFFLPSACCGG